MADSNQPTGQSLSTLRGSIDELDHELLALLARRNALVSKIALYKRKHSVPIRDFARERAILDDRCERATSLGLSAELIESTFRLILRGSRDRQASLKAELPMEFDQKTVAIIGGCGAMGRTLAQLFGDLGHEVMVADLATALTPEEAVRKADVIVISVPIERTVDVIQQLGPLIRPDALLMDVTSLKQPAMEAMLASSESAVVGTHPLFGPSVHSLQGQRIVLCRGRSDHWFAWLSQMLGARGLVIKETTAEEHDRAMSIVQVLIHFSTEVMGRTLARLKVDIDETLAFTSPVYLMELIMTARHFAQSPALYASIEMGNPETRRVTNAFVEAADSVRNIVDAGDRESFDALFDEVRTLFGPFTDQAMEQSSYLIDRLVERG